MGDKLRRDRLEDGDPIEAIEADVSRSRSRIVEAPVLLFAFMSMEEMDAYPDQRRQTAEHTMAVQSTAMAIQNVLLAAHAEGLGACIMCAPLFCPEVIRKVLDTPCDWHPQALITVARSPRSRQGKRENPCVTSCSSAREVLLIQMREAPSVSEARYAIGTQVDCRFPSQHQVSDHARSHRRASNTQMTVSEGVNH